LPSGQQHGFAAVAKFKHWSADIQSVSAAWADGAIKNAAPKPTIKFGKIYTAKVAENGDF